MTDRLQSYAQKTARELVRAGHQPSHVTHHTSTPRQVEERTGLLRRRVTKTVFDRSTTRIDGWPLWRQAFTVVEIYQNNAPVAQGWTVERQIWLAVDGRLLSLELHTGRWTAGGLGEHGDELISWSVADSFAIRLADSAYHSSPRAKTVPRLKNGNYKPGFYESHVGRRNVPPLDEGMRISRALTQLRKTAGTYAKPPSR